MVFLDLMNFFTILREKDKILHLELYIISLF